MMIKCNGCEQLVSRIPTDKKNGYRTKYVNEEGKAWSGKVCPTCLSSNIIVHSKFSCKRKCRSCGESTGPKRYFNCEKCVPTIEDYNGFEECA